MVIFYGSSICRQRSTHIKYVYSNYKMMITRPFFTVDRHCNQLAVYTIYETYTVSPGILQDHISFRLSVSRISWKYLFQYYVVAYCTIYHYLIKSY
jgi:hypothetical protein